MFSRRPVIAIVLALGLSPFFPGCGQPTSKDPRGTNRDNRWNLPERLLRYRRHIDEAQAAARQIVADYVPKTPGQIDDLSLPIADLLSGLPGVIQVTGHQHDAPTQRIIHLIDNPLPMREEFLFCLRRLADGGVTWEQRDLLYEDYLQQTELLQLEQMALLRCLIEHHGLQQIFVEGLTSANLPTYRKKIESLREGSADAAEADQQREGAQQGNQLVHRQSNLLEIGAAGRLLVLGEIQDLLPLDDPELMGQSTLQRDLVSTVDHQSRRHSKIHQQKSQAALDFQVQTILNHGAFGLIVGDDHDLTENVFRISAGKCEYIRVKTKWCHEISPLDPNVWGR